VNGTQVQNGGGGGDKNLENPKKNETKNKNLKKK
jgi:hypothetical protein